MTDLFGQEFHPIKEAINAAEREKAGLLLKIADLEKLKERVSLLESFIQQGNLLMGETGASGGEEPKPEAKGNGLIRIPEHIEAPVWERARQLLAETKKPMKLSEIAPEFYKRGWRLSPKNGKEVLRGTLNKKTDIFKYDRKKYEYALRAYPSKNPHPVVREQTA